jgi:hypothetical protein
LNEALDVCEELDLVLFLELKGGSIENVRRMDPKIMCGFTVRREELQYTTSGEPKNQELWKHLLAGLVDRAVFWSTRTWLWQLLGISLLLPYKGDVLEKRIDPDLWYGRGVRLVTWTVNSDDEKTHFENVLRIPYMTDYVRRQGHATKQT